MRILAGATTALRRIVDLGLAVLIVVALFGVVLGKGAPLVGRQTIIIGGGSMEPTIGLGAAIVVAPVAPASLAVGDIVSLRVGPERTTYTHRIVALVDRADGRWLRTKGDANAEPDPSLVPASAVIGRVEVAIPFAGYLLALLSLPMGIMFVLGLAATLLAIAWLLESVEPAPRRVRRAIEPASARSIEPASAGAGPAAARPVPAEPGPDVPLTMLAADDPATRSGEPIAARPAGPGGPAGFGPSSAWPFAGPAFAAAGGPSPARPTVRAQIERSREVRRRRARWQLDGGGRRTPE